MKHSLNSPKNNKVYNEAMARNHFSKKGGPYFVGQTFSQHNDPAKPKISLLAKIKKLLKLSK